MTTPTDTVATLMAEALMKATHPDGHTIEIAGRLLGRKATGPLPKGAKRRMSMEDAVKAAACVTRMMRRHGLAPATICNAAGVAGEANNFYKFHLTGAELDDDGKISAALSPKRRIHKSVGPYIAMTRQIAKAAGIAEAVLLQELGMDLATYLAPFAEGETDPYEELARHLAMIGPFFSKPRKGSDGEPIDLREFNSFCAREDVSYHPARRVMVGLPEEPYPDHGFDQAPTVPLFMRAVAFGTVECRSYGMPDNEAVPFGRQVIGGMRAHVVELISLGVAPDRKGILRTVFFAEPWTLTYGQPGPVPASEWLPQLSAMVQGTPYSAGLLIPSGDTSFGVSFGDDLKFLCPLHEEHVRSCLADACAEENGSVIGYCLEEVNVARRVELDPGVLQAWLARGNDAQWRSRLKFLKDVPSWAPRLALPLIASLPGGLQSESLLDRMMHAVFGDERTIIEGLIAETTARVRAMDDFVDKRSGAEHGRKVRFRRLMNS